MDNMKNKLISEKTAKKLIGGGVIGLASGMILYFVILLLAYGNANECLSGTNTCSDNDTMIQVGANLAPVLTYVSLIAIVTGVVMIIATSVKGKQQVAGKQIAPPKNPKLVKRLIIKTLAFATAFFVVGFIVSLIVASLASALFPARDTSEQGRIFAYLIIVLYPLIGGFAVYLTNKWLNKKLR
jgi:disulfide bond formation protein DsbB